jgi:hypothetical protein
MRAIVLTLFFGLVTLCRADILTLTFDVSPVSASPGEDVEFTGTLTNNTDETIYINADSFTFAIPGALDDSPFLNNAPISLAPDQVSSDFEMFDVMIPAGTPNGEYNGVFTVLGGSDANALDVLNTISGSFGVQVTPEPAALPFLGIALGALVYARRRFSRS